MKDALGKEIKDGQTVVNVFIKDGRIQYRKAVVLSVRDGSIRIQYQGKNKMHYSNIYRTNNRIIILKDWPEHSSFAEGQNPVNRFEIMDIES